MDESANKKRKVPSSTGDDEGVTPNNNEVDVNDPLSMVKRIIQLLDVPIPEAPPSLSARRQRIVQLKDELVDLEKLRKEINVTIFEAIYETEDKKKNEICALYDSFCPLLSLGEEPCLIHILGYLDEEALFCAEQSSTTLFRIIMDHGHWARLSDRLEEKYYKGYRFADFIPDDYNEYNRTRIEDYYTKPQHLHGEYPDDEFHHPNASFLRYFGTVAKSALELEVLGEKYYDYSSERDNTLIRAAGNELDFQGKMNNRVCNKLRGIYSRRGPILYRHITTDGPYEDNIWFLRISRARNMPDTTATGGCDSHMLLWQGTWDYDWTRYPITRLHGMRSDVTFLLNEDKATEWPELKQFWEWHNNGNQAFSEAEAEKRARETFGGIRLSIVMNHQQLLSTGGFERTRRYDANQNGAHQKTWLHSRYESEDGRCGLCIKTLFSMEGSKLFLYVRGSNFIDGVDRSSEENWMPGSYLDGILEDDYVDNDYDGDY